MSNSYKDKYDIIKTFKNDEYQTILIGSNKENVDEVVVINLLHKDKISKITSESDFSNGLDSLLYLEDENEDLVIITEYNDGTPLESYLKYSKTTIKHKINLVYEYMTKITKYDVFHNSIKNLLVDESQIMIKDDALYFNELLFLDENFSQEVEFNSVTEKIAQSIEKILFSNESDEDNENDLMIKRILKFISKLKNHDHDFQSIKDVYNSFRNIYIYDLFMEDNYKLDDEGIEFEDNPTNVDEIEDNKSTDTKDAENIHINTDSIEDSDDEAPEDENNLTVTDEIVEAKDDETTSGVENSIVGTDEINDDNIIEAEDNIEGKIEKEEDDEEIKINLIVKEDVLEESGNNDSSSKDEDGYNLYLNDIDDKDEEVDSDSSEDLNNNTSKEKPSKSSSYNPKLVIGIVAIAILLLAALHKPILNVLNSPTMTQADKPKAYFIFERAANTYTFTNKSEVFGEDNGFDEISWKIYKGDELVDEFYTEKKFEHRFKNEGEYRVVLSIKDKFGNSDEYSENITHINNLETDELGSDTPSTEKLDKLNLKYSDSSIVKNYKAFRSGNYSLMLGQKGKSNSEKLIIDNINIDDKPIISMWAAASSKENIKILVKGYKNDRLQFENITTFIPQEINTWEMIEVSDTPKNIDKLEMIFSNFTSPIWLDDIEIGSYK